METFQAMKGGKVTPLTINTTVIEIASDNANAVRKRNLDHGRFSLSVRRNERIEKKKRKRFNRERSEEYRKVNNNIKKCTKKAKEREQCSEIEENLRKNNSKRAYQLVKDLTTVKKGKLLQSKTAQEIALQKNERF